MTHVTRRITGFRDDLVTEHEIERLLFHMPAVAERATDPKVKAFARDMARRRKFPNWRPTPKQLAWMRRLVADLFPDPSEEVIDAAD